MDDTSIAIKGCQKIKGTIKVSGSKNSSLPIIVATSLVNGGVIVENVPNIYDVQYLIAIFRELGSQISFESNILNINNSELSSKPINSSLSSKLRASSLLIAPLLAKFKFAKIAYPGGCNIGLRSLDMHIMALSKMGAEFIPDNNFIIAKTKQRLQGAEIKFHKISVGATQSAIMAAILAQGKSIIQNIAIEPEVLDLINFLNKSGARIQFADERALSIVGVESLNSTKHRIIPDRIEAATYIFAAILTKGEITLHNVDIAHLSSVLKVLSLLVDTRIESHSDSSLYIKYLSDCIVDAKIATAAYPGFPTDLQAQLMVVLSQLEGTHIVEENIFDNRFMHVYELQKMGAKIKVVNNMAFIEGRTKLYGAVVNATDLRAAAALLMAGMIAEGETTIYGSRYIHRGYENIQQKLSACCVSINADKILDYDLIN